LVGGVDVKYVNSGSDVGVVQIQGSGLTSFAIQVWPCAEVPRGNVYGFCV